MIAPSSPPPQPSFSSPPSSSAHNLHPPPPSLSSPNPCPTHTTTPPPATTALATIETSNRNPKTHLNSKPTPTFNLCRRFCFLGIQIYFLLTTLRYIISDMKTFFCKDVAKPDSGLSVIKDVLTSSSKT